MITNKEHIRTFIKGWIKKDNVLEPNEHGVYIYSAGPVSINIEAYFEHLLMDYIYQEKVNNKEQLLNFANHLNECAGFPLNSEGFEEVIEEFINNLNQ